MTYPETLSYLESFINYERVGEYPYKQSMKLERVKEFLAVLGNPQNELACVHVAGSKGKGSTCAFIAYILRRAGYRVGLYTSPHLVDFRERIRILSTGDKDAAVHQDFEGMISCEELAGAVTGLKPLVEEYNSASRYGPLTFFEIYTALAFQYFRKSNVDFAVLETGLGGRLDATNTVCPLVCVLTPVSYEHTDKLGKTLADIAREKSGIIKACASRDSRRHPVVVSAAQEPEAAAVIRTRCEKTGAQLYEVGRDITYSAAGDTFSVRGVFSEYTGLRTKLAGAHQVGNTALATGAVEALRHRGIEIGVVAVREGIADAVWPGRCEVLGRDPLVVVDGAQNVSSCTALSEAMHAHFRYRRLILVIGISSDKDIAGICGRLSKDADMVIATRSANPRAAPAQEIAAAFPGKDVMMTQSVAEARKAAYALAQRDDAILVCGSLFVVGEFKYGKG